MAGEKLTPRQINALENYTRFPTTTYVNELMRAYAGQVHPSLGRSEFQVDALSVRRIGELKDYLKDLANTRQASPDFTSGKLYEVDRVPGTRIAVRVTLSPDGKSRSIDVESDVLRKTQRLGRRTIVSGVLVESDEVFDYTIGRIVSHETLGRVDIMHVNDPVGENTTSLIAIIPSADLTAEGIPSSTQVNFTEDLATGETERTIFDASGQGRRMR